MNIILICINACLCGISKKNNTITYLNLQDALKVGGFGIDKKIQKAILEYSLKYVINGNRVLNHNKYIISLKFCTDFL